jgi:Polyketide cyclase / dehydrase and lipid transport
LVVSGEIRIEGTRAAVWSVASDVAAWSRTIKGVRQIEIVTPPTTGLTGLRWKETRLLFDEPTTVEKWVTEWAEPEFFTSRAEQDGFVFTTTLRLDDRDGSVVVTSTHRTDALTLGARLRALPLVLFRRVIRKALMEDLRDIKAAVERPTR